MQYSIAAAAILTYAAAVSATPLAPTAIDSCNNAGIDYQIWVHGSPDNAAKPEDWDPLSLESKGRPDFQGRRLAIGTGDNSFSGFADGHQGVIYDNGPMDTGHVAILHTGYIYADQAGDYTFTMQATDDATYVYAGKDCDVKKTAGRSAAGIALFGSQQLGGADASKKLVNVPQGSYIPFEVRWSNVMRGPYNLALTVTGPDGSVYLNKSGSKNVVTHPCPKRCKIYSASGLQ